MTLFKLKSATTILIEDDYNKNCLPLLQNLVEDSNMMHLYCFEQPISVWQSVFKKNVCHYHIDTCTDDINIKQKSTVIIDSVNQMSVQMGWNNCLRILKHFQNDPNVSKVIIILHKDCILLHSKLQIHLNHLAHAIITFDSIKGERLFIQIKKAGKFIKSEEVMAYDARTSTLNLAPIVKLSKKDEVEKVAPANLTTFKIETDQISQLEKNKLQLPYMSKINEGQGRVFYEPDAVDDWDDEDPDDDLDI